MKLNPFTVAPKLSNASLRKRWAHLCTVGILLLNAASAVEARQTPGAADTATQQASSGDELDDTPDANGTVRLQHIEFRRLQKKLLQHDASVRLSDELSPEEFLRVVAKRDTTLPEPWRWIRRLRSGDFYQRNQAERVLRGAAVLNVDFCQEERHATDAETLIRLWRIHQARATTEPTLFLAALDSLSTSPDSNALELVRQTVDAYLQHRQRLAAQAERGDDAPKTIQLGSTTVDVLDSIDPYSSVNMAILTSALSRCVADDDVGLVQSWTDDSVPDIRLMAAVILTQRFPSASAATLERLLGDPDERIEYFVALQLSKQRPHLAAQKFAKLLESDNPKIARYSFLQLRHLTGKDAIPASIDVNDELIQTCKQWLEKNPDFPTAHLQGNNPTAVHSGDLLVTVDENELVQLDGNHRIVNRLEMPDVTAADVSHDGNCIVASYRGGYLAKVTTAGDLIWEQSAKGINHCRVLKNGDILATFGSEKMVRQYDAMSQRVVWEKRVKSWPNDAIRLQDNNILIVGRERLTLFSAGGDRLWKIEETGSGYGTAACPTDDGGFLVCWSSKIVRYNSNREIVWEKETQQVPHDAFLDDESGAVLVRFDSQIVAFGADGKQNWEIELPGAGTIRSGKIQDVIWK